MLGLMQTKEYVELKGSILQVKNLIQQFTAFAAREFSGLREDIAYLKENKADKKEVRQILDTLDAQSKYFQEYEMLAGQVSRHDRWIQKLAKENGTELEY